MKGERIRIVDIAKELGLSTATVSNVINGKTKKVSDETVKRVQELVEKESYIPNMAGILLAQNSSKIVGIIINNHEKYEGHVLEDDFICASVNALSYTLDEADYFMMIRVTDKWNEIVKIASMWNMEGLILIGFCEQDYKKLREEMHIPFVVYDGIFEETEKICNITIDNFDGGYQVGQYLKAMGHRRVLCISDNYICMDKERIEGVKEAMGDWCPDFMQIPLSKQGRISFYNENFDKLMSYSAIFAVSDFYAIELLNYLKQRGVNIPKDISIVGFDDIGMCEKIYPMLTTVKQDMSERAKIAVSALKELKKGNNEKSVIKLPVQLVKRDSVREVKNYEKAE